MQHGAKAWVSVIHLSKRFSFKRIAVIEIKKVYFFLELAINFIETCAACEDGQQRKEAGNLYCQHHKKLI